MPESTFRLRQAPLQAVVPVAQEPSPATGTLPPVLVPPVGVAVPPFVPPVGVAVLPPLDVLTAPPVETVLAPLAEVEPPVLATGEPPWGTDGLPPVPVVVGMPPVARPPPADGLFPDSPLAQPDGKIEMLVTAMTRPAPKGLRKIIEGALPRPKPPIKIT